MRNFVLTVGLLAVCLGVPGWGQGAKGVANVKVILGKQPSTNSIAMAETDPAGNFSFAVTEAGTYWVQIACPAREKWGLAAGTYGVRLAAKRTWVGE